MSITRSLKLYIEVKAQCYHTFAKLRQTAETSPQFHGAAASLVEYPLGCLWSLPSPMANGHGFPIVPKLSVGPT